MYVCVCVCVCVCVAISLYALSVIMHANEEYKPEGRKQQQEQKGRVNVILS